MLEEIQRRTLETIKGLLDPVRDKLPASWQLADASGSKTVEGATVAIDQKAASGSTPVKDVSGSAVDASGSAVDASGSAVAGPEPWTPTRIAMLTLKIFFAVTFASFAANEMIFEPPAIRVLVFLLVGWLIATVDVAWMIILGGYLIRAIWVKYYNGRFEVKLPVPDEKTSSQAEKDAYKRANDTYKLNKKNYIPRIFALLPLTTVEGHTVISRFFKYIFYYPKSDTDQAWLNIQRGQYMNELRGSVFDWNTVVEKGDIKEQFKEFVDEVKRMSTRVPAPPPPVKAAPPAPSDKKPAEGAIPVALEQGQTFAVKNPIEKKGSNEGIEMTPTAPDAAESKA
jgi:hypothetical protein